MQTQASVYGLMAEYEDPEALLEAAHRAYAEGYRQMDAYSPFPIEGLSEAVGFHRSRLSFVVLCGGIIGAIGGFMLQYYASVVDYPLNIGGRPLNSWPAFVPVTFETTILCAAFAAVLGMLALNKLPQPYHPVFHVKRFERASSDRFFLCIESKDQRFDHDQTLNFLQRTDACDVSEVKH